MNAEQEEAAAVEAMMAARLEPLIRNGGVLLARKATVDDEGDLTLHYYVAMPIPNNYVKMTLEVGRHR